MTGTLADQGLINNKRRQEGGKRTQHGIPREKIKILGKVGDRDLRWDLAAEPPDVYRSPSTRIRALAERRVGWQQHSIPLEP